jgi:hypothetical protein
MRKLGRYLREDGKKFMAIASALLMIAFFLPNLRGKDPQTEAANRVVGSVFDGVKITAAQSAQHKSEWDVLRHQLLWVRQRGDEQMVPMAADVGSAINSLDANPTGFLLLVEEAHQMGITVSNDALQDMLHSHVVNMPDESSESYELCRQAVYDVMLVNNLLSRVCDVIRISQPRQLQLLALTQQDVALNMAELSAKQNLATATPPTSEQIDAQYQRMKTTLPHEPSADNPLGFGYCLPDRVKVQYIGFNKAEVRAYLISKTAQVDWMTQAMRLYRHNTEEFPVASTEPTTQTVVLGPPAWENLPPDVQAKVYDRVYDTAAADLCKKILDHMTEQFAGDWAGYRDAAAKGEAPPMTTLGVPVNSDDYMRHLAGAMQEQFGPRPVLGIINNGWKNSADLALLEGIGTAATVKSQTFGQYATTAGDQFKVAQDLTASDRLALWQPSAPLYTGLAGEPNDAPTVTATGFYLFRLSGMDPSHAQTADEAHDQVVADLLMQQAWNATVAQADKLLAAARQSGVDAAIGDLSPRPTTLTSDYFNLGSAQSTGVIPGTDLKPDIAKLLAHGTIDLLSQAVSGQHSVTEVKLPEERMVALVELKGVRGNWQSPADQMERLTMIAQDVEQLDSSQIRLAWAKFDNASKRTNYKDLSKEQ